MADADKENCKFLPRPEAHAMKWDDLMLSALGEN
jgi:hypothetical protein